MSGFRVPAFFGLASVLLSALAGCSTLPPMPLRGSNTEAGLLIESPPLAHQVRNLIKGDGNEGIYRLRLAADGETIEWVARGSDGKEHGLTEEPDNDRLTRLKLWLIGPLAPEELL